MGIFNSIHLHVKCLENIPSALRLPFCTERMLTAYDLMAKISTSSAETALPTHSTFSFSFFLGSRLYLTIAASCSAGEKREDVRVIKNAAGCKFSKIVQELYSPSVAMPNISFKVLISETFSSQSC